MKFLILTFIFKVDLIFMGHPVAQLVEALRHSWKVAESIPDGVIRIFHWHNPSGHTLALELTQVDSACNRNGYQEYFLAVKAAGAWSWPYHLLCRLSWNLGASTSWNPQGLSKPVMWLLQLFINFYAQSGIEFWRTFAQSLSLPKCQLCYYYVHIQLRVSVLVLSRMEDCRPVCMCIYMPIYACKIEYVLKY